jgi:hypothetical protein
VFSYSLSVCLVLGTKLRSAVDMQLSVMSCFIATFGRLLLLLFFLNTCKILNDSLPRTDDLLWEISNRCVYRCVDLL